MASHGADVHCFEPDPVAFDVLRQKFSTARNVHLHSEAVSSSSGTMQLYFRNERADDPVMYSVGSTLFASKVDVATSNFVQVKFADWRLSPSFERVRLLKLDIEGAECEVLEDLIEQNLLDRVDLTLVEIMRSGFGKRHRESREFRNSFFNAALPMFISIGSNCQLACAESRA